MALFLYFAVVAAWLMPITWARIHDRRGWWFVLSYGLTAFTVVGSWPAGLYGFSVAGVLVWFAVLLAMGAVSSTAVKRRTPPATTA